MKKIISIGDNKDVYQDHNEWVSEHTEELMQTLTQETLINLRTIRNRYEKTGDIKKYRESLIKILNRNTNKSKEFLNSKKQSNVRPL